MSHCVPDFEMEDDDSIPTSSGLARQKKASLHQDELVELLWQNGQVVMQSQNHRSQKKSSLPKIPLEDAVTPAGASTVGKIQPSAAAADEDAAHHLFMEEDEMASWLHYPLDDSFDRDFCADLLYPAPSSSYAVSSRTNQIPEDRRPEDKPPMPPRPPIPPARRAELDSSAKFHNFVHFSRPKARSESRPSTSDKADRESTVVDSSDTPAVALRSRVSHGVGSTAPVSGGNFRCGSMSGDATAATATRTVDRVAELGACELAVTSSSGGSGASGSGSGSGEPPPKQPAEDRKRKAIESDDNECHSEKDVEFEFVNAKKQACGSTSSRKARAAEVHNLSERRRRDRINEKMKALQELIPRCNKSDKASMLDEAIEYLKSLQLQVQMMSMGCSMMPMMFPGVQQYMPPMGMGMGMGMGMDMGMSRPMLPFPSVLPGSAIPSPISASHMGPRFPIQAFHLPSIHTADLSRLQPSNQSDPALNSIGAQCLNQPRVPNFTDPYQRYLGLHQTQVPPPQNQAIPQPSTSKGV